MTAPSLDDRNHTVLLEVVDVYIQKCEPVSSRSLSKKHKKPISPATIRNVMADLEEMGYLHQPHTSAGRIPTDKGYRYFVDHLVNPENVLVEAGTLIENFQPAGDSPNLQKVLEGACNVLSESSHQAGLVMLPSFSNMHFNRIDFFKVAETKALAVFVSDLGVLQNRIIPIEARTSQEELSSISEYLKQEFSGRSVEWIRGELIRRLRDEREHYDRLMKRAMELSAQMFTEDDAECDLLVEGALNFFDQPEFTTDMRKIQSLLQTLEEKTKLVKLLDSCLKEEGVTVFIGAENDDKEMQNCSLIARNYQMGETTAGTLAIFGPKRMDYKKAISIVNQTAQTVSQLLGR